MTLPMLLALGAGGCALIGIYRLLIGPSYTDRLVGLDLLFAMALVFCLLAAWVSGRILYLDVAIGFALAGFIAPLAWARLLQHRHQEDES